MYPGPRGVSDDPVSVFQAVRAAGGVILGRDIGAEAASGGCGRHRRPTRGGARQPRGADVQSGRLTGRAGSPGAAPRAPCNIRPWPVTCDPPATPRLVRPRRADLGPAARPLRAGPPTTCTYVCDEANRRHVFNKFSVHYVRICLLIYVYDVEKNVLVFPLRLSRNVICRTGVE